MKKPVYGRVVASRHADVDFRQLKNGVLDAPQKVQRAKIEEMIINVDEHRLENLVPDRPSEYRDYAEELAPQIADPVARDLARRLLLLAAYHSSQLTENQAGLDILSNDSRQGFQQSALEMLIKLARSEMSSDDWRSCVSSFARAKSRIHSCYRNGINQRTIKRS